MALNTNLSANKVQDQKSSWNTDCEMQSYMRTRP